MHAPKNKNVERSPHPTQTATLFPPNTTQTALFQVNVISSNPLTCERLILYWDLQRQGRITNAGQHENNAASVARKSASLSLLQKRRETKKHPSVQDDLSPLEQDEMEVGTGYKKPTVVGGSCGRRVKSSVSFRIEDRQQKIEPLIVCLRPLVLQLRGVFID